ncbi:MAG TPA: 2-oxoglutarate dehydrogenase E1 component [Nitrolancea sp.]|jgi:2-oxoglutarate dehydrogenase E1 component|nr:2-oxoglutarate dehydrogenase E1 component [Nitrolancea sp.]
MSIYSRFHGPNAGYILDLYERYERDPESVDPKTRAYFDKWRPELPSTNGASAPATLPAVDTAKIIGATKLVESIRERGHFAASLDPLGSEPVGDPELDASRHGLSESDLASLPANLAGGPIATQATNLATAVEQLRAIYSGTTGYDFAHVRSTREREWLIDAIESRRYSQPLSAGAKRAILERLSDVEGFERFLHRAFVGQKRFSIEGTDMLVPMLDQLIAAAAENGAHDVVIGMSHRGRLNVMTHVVGKPFEKLIAEFMHLDHAAPASSDPSTSGWTGDVKYHIGAQKAPGEIPARITVPSNPSHLEFVNPVAEGMTRAAQEQRDQPGAPRQNIEVAFPIVVHGDAAFPGEGVVAETLNLSHLDGYETGGSVHIITNNQIGFTTTPGQGRSTIYASDMARGFEIPVIHVNADDPEACLAATRLAYAFREEFNKDFMIDLIGYRRWGHNEGDEPTFTQPLMYATITAHPTVRDVWAHRLADEGVVTLDEAEQLVQASIERLQQIRQQLVERGDSAPPVVPASFPGLVRVVDTALPLSVIKELNRQIYAFPDGFTLNPKLKRNVAQRLKAVEEGGSLDWAHAEALAFASILADGTPIRLSGQDTERGTFSQRHLVFHDFENGATVTPLQELDSGRASFAVYNSPLSEASTIGFEYGYSIFAPETMILWEGQFGDFANAGQVMIDQFISSARAKWSETPSLVLLLPHGYEGQGPEHSSARLERYLQLAANDNMRVANCTTSAQYFHLLRTHAGLLGSAPRPLMLMTPKSLLRHPAAASPVEALTTGRFQPVLDDPSLAGDREAVSRIVLCSGKVYVDLIGSDIRSASENVALVRLEQLYPFPEEELRRVVASYPNARELVWLQEEPRNMGAWNFVSSRLQSIAGSELELRYTGRPDRASPAEGLAELHTMEQNRIVTEAFAGAPVPELKTYGVKHAD